MATSAGKGPEQQGVCSQWSSYLPRPQSYPPVMFELVWPIPEDRYEDVITHLRHNFFPDEPLNCSVGLCPSPGQPHKQLEDHALYTLADGISVMAVNGDKEVVGVILNGVLKEGDLEKALVKLETIDDDKFKVIFGQLYRLNLELDMFNKFQVDRIFEARILSVDKAYRSLGLAHKLMAKCEEVAADKGFKMIKEDSTGLFSQKILAKLGHQTMTEIKYEDIKDEDGEIIFKTPPPHTSLKVMYKMVSE